MFDKFTTIYMHLISDNSEYKIEKKICIKRKKKHYPPST